MQATIAREAQQAAVGAPIELYELDLTGFGGQVFRFTEAAKVDSPVSFGGNQYQPVPIESEGWEVNSKGQMPRPRLRIANVNNAMTILLQLYGDPLGAPVKRIRTLREHLDDGSDPNPLATFPIDIYRVEVRSAQHAEFVEFTLAAAMDQQGVKLPAIQVTQTVCQRNYRIWNPKTGAFEYTGAIQCPYAGASSYDEKGNPTTPANDKCNKLLRTGCILRFGNADLPFLGFPGVGRT